MANQESIYLTRARGSITAAIEVFTTAATSVSQSPSGTTYIADYLPEFWASFFVTPSAGQVRDGHIKAEIQHVAKDERYVEGIDVQIHQEPSDAQGSWARGKRTARNGSETIMSNRAAGEWNAVLKMLRRSAAKHKKK